MATVVITANTAGTSRSAATPPLAPGAAPSTTRLENKKQRTGEAVTAIIAETGQRHQHTKKKAPPQRSHLRAAAPSI